MRDLGRWHSRLTVGLAGMAGRSRPEARLIVCLCVALLGFLWWPAAAWYHGQLLADQRNHVEETIVPGATALSLAINRRVELLEGLHAFVVSGPSDAQIEAGFPHFAEGLHASLKGIRNFGIYPGGIRKQYYPIEGNDVGMDTVDLLNDERPAVRTDVWRAVQTRRIALSGPYELRQGGVGLVARKAVYRGGEFWGLVTMVIDLPPLFAESGLDALSGATEVAVRDGTGQPLYGRPSLFDGQPVVSRVELLEGAWELAAIPSQGWITQLATPVLLFRFGALALVVLLGTVLYLMVGRQANLAVAVRERTRELADANLGLRSEIDARTRTEERLRRIVETVPDGVIFLDREGLIVFANDSAERSLGLTAGDAGERTYDDHGRRIAVTDGSHFPDDQLPFMRVMATGEPVQGVEHAMIRGDGSRVTLSVNAAPLRNAAGDLEGVVASVTDITARRDSEEALRSAMHLLERTFASLEEAVFLVDPYTHRVVACNPAVERLFGYAPAEIVGQSPASLHVDAEGYERFNRSCYRLLMRGKPFETEYRMKRRNGEVFESDHTVTRVVDADGRLSLVVSVVRDITHRRRLEERLLRAQRLETAGRIAGQVAHDFNNLLGPLVTYPELMKLSLPDGHPAVRFCDDMIQSASRMADISSDLLVLSRRGLPQDEVVDLNQVVRQTLKAMGAIPESLKLETRLAPGLARVKGSSSQLIRAVSNLVANARDAMEDCGVLTISTEMIYVDAPLGKLGQVDVGEYVRVTVGDTGPGIAAEIRNKIFDAFFSTKTSDKQRGSGLGLSIVQSVIEDHRGNIELTSELGLGTVFTIYLPADERVTARADVGLLKRGRESILLVDDDAVQRRLGVEVLSSLGYRVRAVSSGEEALEFLEKSEVDLLLLDMIMPGGMDGLETYQRVAEMRPGQKAIILSGFSESGRVSEAQAMGAGAYLRKPVGMEQLSRAVREELDG